MKGEGLKLISKVYVYGSSCEFKWSGKYMKMLSLFVRVSVGDVLGLVRMEKMVNNPNYTGFRGQNNTG